MPNKLSSVAIEGLRSTLQKIEQQSGLMPDDSALLELKRILLGRIAELEDSEQAGPVLNGATIASAAGPRPASGDPAMRRALELAVSLVAERKAAGPLDTDVSESQNMIRVRRRDGGGERDRDLPLQKLKKGKARKSPKEIS